MLQVIVVYGVKPKKQVISKKWHRDTCYRKRVDKKWLKRYGSEHVLKQGKTLVHNINKRVYCNPADYAAIMRELQKHENAIKEKQNNLFANSLINSFV